MLIPCFAASLENASRCLNYYEYKRALIHATNMFTFREYLAMTDHAYDT